MTAVSPTILSQITDRSAYPSLSAYRVVYITRANKAGTQWAEVGHVIVTHRVKSPTRSIIEPVAVRAAVGSTLVHCKEGTGIF